MLQGQESRWDANGDHIRSTLGPGVANPLFLTDTSSPLQVLEIEPVDARGNTKVRILSPPLQPLLPPPPPPVEALRSHYPI